METRIKRRIAIGAAGLTILGGGGGAYALADRGGDDERQAFMSDAAKRLHVSPSELRSALKGAMDDRIDADVKKGRLTQKQADAIKAHKPPNGRPERGLHVGGPFMDGLQAAAKYLGLSNADLRKQLDSGKSLAQVAKDRNKSVDDLKAAIKATLQKDLDSRVDALVNQSGPPGPPKGTGFRHFRAGPGPGGPGPGGPGGPPPGF